MAPSVDRDKVIEELEHCRQLDFEMKKPTQVAIDNALAFLKELEPIPCGEKIKAGDVVLDFYECGYCKNAIRKPWRYCPFCGKEAKW